MGADITMDEAGEFWDAMTLQERKDLIRDGGRQFPALRQMFAALDFWSNPEQGRSCVMMYLREA